MVLTEFLEDSINTKIESLIEGSEFLSKYRSGVYSSVTLDGVSLQKMWKYLKNIGLPMQHIQNAHITVIYSRTRPQAEPVAFDINGSVTPVKFGIFGRGNKDEPYVLVLEVDSPELRRAHQKIKKDLNIKATYRDYAPHITLVLDMNRLMPGLKHLSEPKKKAITNIFDKMIPELPKSIKILKHTVDILKP